MSENEPTGQDGEKQQIQKIDVILFSAIAIVLVLALGYLAIHFLYTGERARAAETPPAVSEIMDEQPQDNPLVEGRPTTIPTQQYSQEEIDKLIEQGERDLEWLRQEKLKRQAIAAEREQNLQKVEMRAEDLKADEIIEKRTLEDQKRRHDAMMKEAAKKGYLGKIESVEKKNNTTVIKINLIEGALIEVNKPIIIKRGADVVGSANVTAIDKQEVATATVSIAMGKEGILKDDQCFLPGR